MDILREGMRGPQVAELKEKLNSLGYDCGSGDEFDARTGWAVCWFRHENGMEDSHEADDAFLARLASEDVVGGVSRPVQFYNMKDPIWRDYPYDAANTPEIETIATSGCGPTCYLSPHTAGSGDLRCDAGCTAGIPQGGLPSLHSLGQNGAGCRRLPYR